MKIRFEANCYQCAKPLTAIEYEGESLVVSTNREVDFLLGEGNKQGRSPEDSVTVAIQTRISCRDCMEGNTPHANG